MKLDVIYEDNHILAVNKPSGFLVQGDKTGDMPLVEHAKAYIKAKYNKPGEVFLGIPHRLDRPTSGILLFARTSKSLARLNELFRSRQIQKTYWAVVKQAPKNQTGKLENYLFKNQEKNRSFVTKDEEKGQLAELSYKILDKSDVYTLLEINPKSGRHHQIRVQLSKIGSPIKGDVKYGFDRANKDKSIHLHARSIGFVHPIKQEEMKLVAKVPEENLWKFFESNGNAE